MIDIVKLITHRRENVFQNKCYFIYNILKRLFIFTNVISHF